MNRTPYTSIRLLNHRIALLSLLAMTAGSSAFADCAQNEQVCASHAQVERDSCRAACKGAKNCESTCEANQLKKVEICVQTQHSCLLTEERRAAEKRALDEEKRRSDEAGSTSLRKSSPSDASYSAPAEISPAAAGNSSSADSVPSDPKKPAGTPGYKLEP
jgi:hypothetical protein